MSQKLILLSPENDIENESGRLNELFENGLELFHLRKPTYTSHQIEHYLKQINPMYLKQIVVHSHHHLAKDFGLRGIHLTSRFRAKSRYLNEETLIRAARNTGLTVSTSIHSLVELRLINERYDYCFLSPVFDSMSKQDYKGMLDTFSGLESMKNERTKVYALGGVRLENLERLVEYSFDGVGLIGYIWQSEQPVNKYIELASRVKIVFGG